MLLRFTVLAREIIVTVKFALSRGSSQQGKARLAWVAYRTAVRGVKDGWDIAKATSN